MTYADVAVVIPAYKPDARMNKFIRALGEKGFSRIVVVDDGGGADYGRFFDAARSDGAVVLTHEENLGKGAALKTGLRHLLEHGAAPVITADCDGQHSPNDVARMADVMSDSPGALVLGTRDKRMMPPRSRLGNTVTCAALGLLTGLWIRDTQTGLRGLPEGALPDFAALDGDRYEYEMNMLIKARQLNMAVVQLGIDTIYFDENKGSHFDTLRDSARIYSLLFQQIGRYIGSSAVAAIVDIAAFGLLVLVFPERNMLAFCIVVSRVISSVLNYFVNREMVFKSRAGRRSIVYFYLLVAAVLALNYGIVYLFTSLGMIPVVAKVIADIILFVFSYNVQQKFIFRDRIC